MADSKQLEILKIGVGIGINGGDKISMQDQVYVEPYV